MHVPLRASVAGLVLLACSPNVEREDPYAHPGHQAAPPTEKENAAPLDSEAEAARERALGMSVNEPGEVQTKFEPLGSSDTRLSIHASAGLKEVPEGVRVHLRVFEGPPGTARLAVEDAPCSKRSLSHTRAPTALERRGATPGPASTGAPGPIVLQGSGQADYTTTLKGKQLEPGAENSLAGQALVLYEARDLPSPAGRTAEVPVLCAMVPGR